MNNIRCKIVCLCLSFKLCAVITGFNLLHAYVNYVVLLIIIFDFTGIQDEIFHTTRTKSLPVHACLPDMDRDLSILQKQLCDSHSNRRIFRFIKNYLFF